MTPEQEKALHDALGPVLFIQPTPNSDTQQPKARLAVDTPCYLL